MATGIWVQPIVMAAIVKYLQEINPNQNMTQERQHIMTKNFQKHLQMTPKN